MIKQKLKKDFDNVMEFYESELNERPKSTIFFATLVQIVALIVMVMVSTFLGVIGGVVFGYLGFMSLLGILAIFLGFGYTTRTEYWMLMMLTPVILVRVFKTAE